MMDMTFEAIAPIDTATRKGGKQEKKPVTLRIFTFPEMVQTSSHNFQSIFEAAKFSELFNSRSNLAAAIKSKGYYHTVQNGKLLVFTK